MIYWALCGVFALFVTALFLLLLLVLTDVRDIVIRELNRR